MCANEENQCDRLSLLFNGPRGINLNFFTYYFASRQVLASFWHKNYDLLIF